MGVDLNRSKSFQTLSAANIHMLNPAITLMEIRLLINVGEQNASLHKAVEKVVVDIIQPLRIHIGDVLVLFSYIFMG